MILQTFAECANTDIQAVFDLVLSTAVKNKTLPEDMPSKLYIISDMEFDYCAENSDVTNFEYAKEKFEQNGYALPKVVFWNVASRNMQSPVEMNEQGVTLVSGCNPRIFSMVTEDKCTPYEYMLDVLNQRDMLILRHKKRRDGFCESQFQVLCKPSLWCRIEIH